jgi:hypothetical protein
MAHVTIPSEATRITYSVGATATDTFTIPFAFFQTDGADVVVYDGTTLQTTSTYTITGIAGTEGGFTGGTLVLDTAVTSTTITLVRDITVERTSDFPISGPFNITTLNTELDTQTAILQDLEGRLDRSIFRAETSIETYSLELPDGATTTPATLQVSTDGGLELGPDPNDAATQATAAAASAAAALVSENAAAADLVLTNADLVLTNADVVTTNADVVLADAAAASAAASAAGIYWKAPCEVSSTANLTLSGEQTIDGILTSGSRIVVRHQTAAAENGIYTTAAGAWARTAPMDTWDEHVGAVVLVNQGTAYANTAYQCTVTPGGTLDTTDITWSAFGAVAINQSVDNWTDTTDYTSGTTTALTLTTDPGSENNCAVSFDGVMQHHNTYSVSGTTLTFDAAIPLGTANIEARYASSVGVGTPSDGTVTTAKIAVTTATMQLH